MVRKWSQSISRQDSSLVIHHAGLRKTATLIHALFKIASLRRCNKRKVTSIKCDIFLTYLKCKILIFSSLLYKYYYFFYVWVSVHHKLIYIKRTNVMQLGSMFICNCNIALHVSEAFCVHLQEHLEIVEVASGE